tara:strand:- start:4842 stop:6152 length:1311 start_codon:yes stop_codon:yes gene_type:complete
MKLLSNQRGVAILMVISTIAILTFLLADFTFETKLNKIKVYNFQEREQARLNAEAGMSFALAKLRLYRQAINTLETTPSLKDVLRPSLLENVVTQPFMFPLPVPGNASSIQKEALTKFMDDNLLQGQVSVSIQAVSGFLNPNNLVRPDVDPDAQQSQSQQQSEEEKPPYAIIEQKFIDMFEKELQNERESNENFDLLYGDADPELLVGELKYVVNRPETLDDPVVGNIAAMYSDKSVTPKHAPFTSLDELYALVGWNDAIVDLVKNRLTVHEVTIIPLNEMTKDQLQLLFPEITPEQIEEFFKWRDGNAELGDEPHPFKSVDEFKNLIVSRLAVAGESDYEARIKEFADIGIKLGVAGKLFKVISKGVFNRSEFEITAWIDLPTAPEPTKPKPTPTPEPGEGEGEEAPPPQATPTPTPTPAPMQLLEPRVIEIRPS